MKRHPHASKQRLQRGTSLIFALVALAGLSVAGAAMMRSADTSSLVAGALSFHETATKASERAIEAGIAAAAAASDRDSHDATHNYYANVESANLEPTSARLGTGTANAVVDAPTGNTARYVVERMCSATGASSSAGCVTQGSAPLYRVTALVTGPRFVSATTQAFFALSEPTPECGLITQGSVTVSGESFQRGTANCYHSNVNLTISGALRTSGLEGSAHGTVSYSGGGSAVTTNPSAAEVVLPPVVPSSHKSYARQVFKADGTITGSGFVTSRWTWDSGNKVWILNTDHDSSLPPAGLYYFETNVEIPKKIGTPSLPATISIVAERSIKISAEVYLRDFTDVAHPAATNRVFIMAGGDLELPGSSRYYDSTRSSMMAAGAELKVNGSIIIEANLVARNEAAPSGSMDWASENTVSGTLDQTYNGTGASATPTATRQGWRIAAN